MNIGQRVLLIATWAESHCVPPPIGAVGEIVGPIDLDGDYEVSFPDHPCYSFDPDWFVPHWAIVPINDPPSVLEPECTAETVSEVHRD